MSVLSSKSSIGRFQEEAEARFRAHKRNVVLAGETGVGKSSLINLIANKNIAGVSNDSLGCTSEIQNYHTVIGRDSFEIWDTPGLDEGPGAKRVGYTSSFSVPEDGASLAPYRTPIKLSVNPCLLAYQLL